MQYADIPDWEIAGIVAVESAQAAIAVEAMAHAKLANQGHGLARFKWTRLPDKKECFAEECFSCDSAHAVAVVEAMAEVYKREIA